MHDETGLLSESLAAVIADEGSLAGVDALVSDEWVSEGEELSAEAALMTALAVSVGLRPGRGGSVGGGVGAEVEGFDLDVGEDGVGVSDLVGAQGSEGGEALGAGGAGVGSFAGVLPLVDLHVALAGEALAAEGASVGSLAGVTSLMDGEGSFLGGRTFRRTSIGRASRRCGRADVRGGLSDSGRLCCRKSKGSVRLSARSSPPRRRLGRPR